MKETPLILIAALALSQSAAAEESIDTSVGSLQQAFTDGQIKGQLRYSAQYRDSNLHVLQDSSSDTVSDEKQQQYSALGGYLGFETAPFFNTSAGITFYTSNPLGNNPDDRRGLGGLDESDGGQDSYNVLGGGFHPV